MNETLPYPGFGRRVSTDISKLPYLPGQYVRIDGKEYLRSNAVVFVTGEIWKQRSALRWVLTDVVDHGHPGLGEVKP